ncbi:uncharacterized protein cubi_00327 [Cryptosporidium ubiquitum]|uniref:Uncharacterized protein n=1 Tax=Cryptosporidium ubiquitum TaxID=857276 RepID=A0A1J4MKQ8_9CRYT|nr:uncharacterized protein cubi_00327 [Cryptosporidium ubiquitum]OII74774.1 hypothetical protein cubi_00327 [Cryptosporidium ubiquitum]
MNNIEESGQASPTLKGKVEAERQQHIIVDKKRLITFTLTDICSLLEKVMEQQGDESVITCGDIDWNLIASQLDKDPFEIEYFWRVFNPDVHFKPSLGYAIVPVELNLNQETLLLYSNIDHRTNAMYNYKLQNSINSKMDSFRNETILKPILDFANIKMQLLKSADEAKKKINNNSTCTPADGAGGKCGN